MTAPRLEVTREVDAPADTVYGVFADYRIAHPAILPKPAFQSLTVEKGGQGAGTVIRVVMQGVGGNQTLRLYVTEPQPGRVLKEEDPTEGIVTHFTVTPILTTSRSMVSIATEWREKQDIWGRIQGWLIPRLAKGVYEKELDLLEAYLKNNK